MLNAHMQNMFLWLLEIMIEKRLYLEVCLTVCQSSNMLGQDLKTAIYSFVFPGITCLICDLCMGNSRHRNQQFSKVESELYVVTLSFNLSP